MIAVKFPDGTRQVPSRPRYIERTPLGSRTAQRIEIGDEPVPDSDWIFNQLIDQSWQAFRR